MAEHANSDDAPLPVSASRPKVIYVMGTGRSGSTILGVALGNCANVFFAGELNQWLVKSGVPTYDGPEQGRFWDVVREDVDDAAELFGGKASCLERSSALLDVRKWRRRRQLRGRYRRVSEDLYLSLMSATGATHIVDTSHYPLRARELQKLSGIDLYLLFLARDPQSVVASLGRHDVPERRFGVPTANVYIWLTNLLSVLVFLRHPRDRRLFVRHEDLLADPESVLRQILHHLDSPAPVPELGSLRTGVPIHGNRLIGADVVVLKRRIVARARGSRVTAVLQLPWAAVFSRLRPATSASASHEPVEAPDV